MPIFDRLELEDQRMYSRREIENFPYLFRCDEPRCNTSLAASSFNEAVRTEQQHLCKEVSMDEGIPDSTEIITPQNKPVRKNVSDINTHLSTEGGVAVMWSMIDSVYDEFRSTTPNDAFHEHLKAKLSGMSEMLLVVMKPYFEKREQIVQEVLRRANARDNDEALDTPGVGWISISPEDGGVPWRQSVIGGYTSNPREMVELPPGYPEKLAEPYRERRAAIDAEKAARENARQDASRFKADTKPAVKPASKPAVNLDAKTVAEIKERSAQGFDNKMLAIAYKIKESDVAWALEQ